MNIFRSKYKTTVDSVELYRGDQVLTSKSVYFRSALKTADKTAIFLQGDNFTKATVKTTAEDAPKLLIIKGSYATFSISYPTLQRDNLGKTSSKRRARPFLTWRYGCI